MVESVVSGNSVIIGKKEHRTSIISYILTFAFYIILIADVFFIYVIRSLVSIGDVSFRLFAFRLLQFQVISAIIAIIYLKIFGAQKLIITEEHVTIKRFLLKSKNISHDNIKKIDFQRPKNFISAITGDWFVRYEHLVIYSLDNKIDINLSLFTKNDILKETINVIPHEDDEFIKRFLDERPKFDLYNIFKNPNGIIGIILVGIALYYYLFGALNSIFFPPDTLIQQAYNLRSPEYLFGFQDDRLIDGPPSSRFKLGNDFVGRDYYSRLIYGMYSTMNMVFAISIITMIMALVIGSISGLASRTLDSILLRIMDGIISIPIMVFWIFGMGYSGGLRLEVDGGFFWNILFLTSIFIWAGPAKIIRTEIRHIKSKEFVQALYIFGSSKYYIFKKHIIPTIFPIILMLFLSLIVEFLSMTIAIAVLFPSDGSLIWGSDLNRRLDVSYYPQQDIFDTYFIASTAIFSITIFGFLLLGNALKDLTKMER